ncbi:Gfo/Idh/MocA family oxidoreductase [Vineibacter terrae]|uniref:Gfo/Idh/MocA family protein n=1 Tax=Vineibacter terrae TaxID=2586908 RepID=UPI002E322984|nr:Gfo/Idh/MocA family oxidoreductase [Vineibacter terrae]HEX2885198.1 Gfo/Idh/MocA family oxidoreductase [Vineibacter terrae]
MIRTAILSFAHYHASFWSEAFAADPRVAFTGIWDDDPARGQAAAEKHGTRFVADLEALLDAVDAVAITSETAQHRRLIERAAQHGCAILCEKPIAANLADADAIAAAVAAHGVTFMQSFPKRFDPVNHEIKRIVESGALGTIWLARVRHGHSHGLDEAFRTGWWADPARSGGGTLIDEGVHAADFLRWLFGEPESVQATVSNTALKLPVDDTGVAVFHWTGGLVGEIATGWLFHAADVSVEIYGSAGSIALSGVDLASRDTIGNGPHLRVAIAGTGERRWDVSPMTPRFVTGQFHHQNAIRFVDALVDGSAPPIGLADGRGALAMIIAAYRSAREGRRVWLRQEQEGS